MYSLTFMRSKCATLSYMHIQKKFSGLYTFTCHRILSDYFIHALAISDFYLLSSLASQTRERVWYNSYTLLVMHCQRLFLLANNHKFTLQAHTNLITAASLI